MMFLVERKSTNIVSKNTFKNHPKSNQNPSKMELQKRTFFEERFGSSKIFENVVNMSPTWPPLGSKGPQKTQKIISNKSSKTNIKNGNG